MTEFLEDVDPRRWLKPPAGTPDYLKPVEFYLGVDPDKGRDIVVRVVDADRAPARGDLEKLWQSMAQTPVLVLAVRYKAKGAPVVDLVGGRRKLPADAPKGTRPRPLLVQKVPVIEARKFCQIILAEETPHAANRLVARWMDERATDMPGLKNDGLFARHALLNYVPERPDWPPASEKAAKVRDKAGRDLVKALGFQIDDSSEPNAALLTIDGAPTASALFLEGAASFDEASALYGAISPVTHALTVARRHRVRWVVLTRKRSIRLHPVSPDLGVGRRGRTTTYVEINLDMLPEDRAAFLWLLFSSDALADGGTVDQILAASERFANDLGSRLRERVYNEVVPGLATALGRQLADSDEDGWLEEAYHRTMVVLFRLLFVAYAEDKGLLPYERNVPYTNASLKTLARELIPYIQGEQQFSADSAVFWRRVVNLWRAVDRGKSDWGIPPYNGGLFSSTTPTGAALNKLELTDVDFGPALARLLVDVDADGVEGPVDFRSLSVREFGSIYEGLLESELAVAETDLTTDKKDVYVPAGKKGDVIVSQGEVYFHNASGARKSSGSYFTKPFAVEHLLDHALEPAVADHFQRVLADLERGDDAAATRRFFDFRCVDVAMGSGHFLVAAVDRLEARFSEFLDEHPIPGVTRELETLREAALNELRHCADDALIENAALLRRQIARRCVYGVDLNPVSVELARLAIWIHTFVPGLPLSFLDHNLVAGNSLTGIGTLDEALGALGGSLGSASLDEMIGAARPALERLATVSDATVADVKAARAAHEEALNSIAGARELFDLLVLDRANLAGVQLLQTDPETVSSVHTRPEVTAAVGVLNPLHYPIAFPEVFLRDRPGFDCILGNPPWEEVVVEELQFWSRHFPGLKGLENADQQQRIGQLRKKYPSLTDDLEAEKATAEALRRFLTSGVYPGMEVGDPDLYKAFLWRFAHLAASSGTTGVVLPRSVFAALGSAPWRQEVFQRRDLDITLCKNKDEWLFTDVNPGYPICLVAILPASAPPELRVRGTYMSIPEYRNGISGAPARIAVPDLLAIDDSLCVPAIDTAQEMSLLSRLVQQPAFGDLARPDWTAVPVRELDASNDKAEFFTDNPRHTPVYNHLNVGHYTFDESQGAFNWANLKEAKRKLQAKRKSSSRKARSPFRGMPPGWEDDAKTLPCVNPRLVFRDVVHSSNPRKVWFAVAPRDLLLTNKAPYLVFWRGDLHDQAYVLGLMNSAPVDWYGHLRVNLNLNYFILNSIPVPVREHSAREERLVELAAGLALAASGDLGEWSSLTDPIVDDDKRARAVAEIDAISTLLYELDDDHLPLIFNTDTRPPVDLIREFRSMWT
jgi:hypothetical protein